jgi:hypothetical protein
MKLYLQVLKTVFDVSYHMVFQLLFSFMSDMSSNIQKYNVGHLFFLN